MRVYECGGWNMHLAVFRYDLQRICRELDLGFLQRFPFTQILCLDAFTTATNHPEGWCSRQRQDVTYWFWDSEITCFCLQHSDTNVSSYSHKLSWHLCWCLQDVLLNLFKRIFVFASVETGNWSPAVFTHELHEFSACLKAAFVSNMMSQ